MFAGDQTVYLVVEDAADRDALGLLLGARGYRAAVFGSGDDFVHAWRPEWAGCIVLDLQAPADRSLALQQRLAEIECHLPVIVATAGRSVEGGRLAFRAGALDYLEKPLDHALLFSAIEEAFVRVGLLEVRRSRREQAILHLQQLQNLARGEPLVAGPGAGPGTAIACTGEAAGARYTALLIQAHALMRAGMAGVLRMAGVENSGTAASLGQGLDLLRRMPACDLILVDPALPDSEGLATIQALRDAAPGTVIMVLASRLPVELARLSFRAGVRGWLETDTPPELMAQAVESVLRGGRYLPEWLAQDFAERSLAADRELAAAHSAGSVTARLEAERVTDRQREVAGLIAEGLSNKEIARRLNISLGTAKNYVAQILGILGVKTRSRAAHLLLNQRGPSLVESG